MDTASAKHRNRAFTTTELMVVVLAIAVVAALVLPARVKARERAMGSQCLNTQRSISVGLRLFAGDAGGYPFAFLSQASNSAPGLSPFATNNPAELWKLFQVAADDLSSPRILVCPSDRFRQRADTFGTNGLAAEFSHPANRLNAISYFLSLDADEESPGNILMGDRYLTIDPEGATDKGTKLLFGQQDIGSASPIAGSVRWTSAIHGAGGNAAFMDGSAQQLTTPKLRQTLTNQAIVANRIWLPNTDATGRGNP